MGNHDYGNTDPYAFCPAVQPTGFINGQPYASAQFNADRNPARPDAQCSDAFSVERFLTPAERLQQGRRLQHANASRSREHRSEHHDGTSTSTMTTTTTTTTPPPCTRHYWLPDYNYHYEVPGADLEVIAIDTAAASLRYGAARAAAVAE